MAREKWMDLNGDGINGVISPILIDGVDWGYIAITHLPTIYELLGKPSTHREGVVYPLKTSECPLKIDGWKMYSLLKWPLFRGHVSFQGCTVYLFMG